MFHVELGYILSDGKVIHTGQKTHPRLNVPVRSGQVIGDGDLSIGGYGNACLWVDIRDVTMVGPESLRPPTD
jgi:hypothetical protein